LYLNPNYELSIVNSHYILINKKEDKYYDIDKETYDFLLMLNEIDDSPDIQARKNFLIEHGIIIDNTSQISINSKGMQERGGFSVTKIKLFGLNVNSCIDKSKILSNICNSNKLISYLRITAAIGVILSVIITVWACPHFLYQVQNSSKRILTYLPFVYCSILLITCLHEVGHVFVCKHFCHYVGKCGVMLFFVTPVLYTNTTISSFLPAKQKYKVIAAGIEMQIAISGMLSIVIAVLLFFGDFRWTAIYLVNLMNITYVLLNLNPLFKYDGYWLLSTKWNTERLYEKSICEVKAVFSLKYNKKINKKKFLFGIAVICFYLIMWIGTIWTIYTLLYPIIEGYSYCVIGVVILLVVCEIVKWIKTK